MWREINESTRVKNIGGKCFKVLKKKKKKGGGGGVCMWDRVDVFFLDIVSQYNFSIYARIDLLSP